ncbi:MAG: hypothetical protein HN725_16575 [Alphaproteobacteria bacterium]|jgi:hypothetical protein|nr:hypothetical protein [Alphaproteobacteria bacterium]MBT4082308.1 hypothetical protein [Alphaproteobacteria bacterium]MBT4542791.1 hypothetical protein [Alphaproteobacteria bacterium]MBT7746907.1 hypothetical protein [Alphaproteobacteria bacterium]
MTDRPKGEQTPDKQAKIMLSGVRVLPRVVAEGKYRAQAFNNKSLA